MYNQNKINFGDSYGPSGKSLSGDYPSFASTQIPLSIKSYFDIMARSYSLGYSLTRSYRLLNY